MQWAERKLQLLSKHVAEQLASTPTTFDGDSDSDRDRRLRRTADIKEYFTDVMLADPPPADRRPPAAGRQPATANPTAPRRPRDRGKRPMAELAIQPFSLPPQYQHHSQPAGPSEPRAPYPQQLAAATADMPATGQPATTTHRAATAHYSKPWEGFSHPTTSTVQAALAEVAVHSRLAPGDAASPTSDIASAASAEHRLSQAS